MRRKQHIVTRQCCHKLGFLVHNLLLTTPCLRTTWQHVVLLHCICWITCIVSVQTLMKSVSGGHWTGSYSGLHTTLAARTDLRSSRRPSLVLRSWVRSQCRPMASRRSPGSSRQASPLIRSDCVSCHVTHTRTCGGLAVILGFSQVSQSCSEMLCSLLLALQCASCLASVHLQPSCR